MNTEHGPGTTDYKMLRFKTTETDGIAVTHPHQKAEALIGEHLDQLKIELTKGLETDEGGIDTQRARDYLAQMGLTVDAQILLLNPEQYAEFNRRAEQSVGVINDGHGGYVPVLNIIAISRDPELEARYGPAVTEYMLVHEMAHASTHIEWLTYNSSDDDSGVDAQAAIGRSGQVTTKPNEPQKPKGLYLEEAFADIIAHQYVRGVLGRENGFADDDTPAHRDMVEIPASYRVGNQVGKQAIAAVGLGLLVGRDPSLMESMVKARNDPKGLQEVAAKISQIGRDANWPDLYVFITKAEKETEFANVTRTIAEELYPELVDQWDAYFNDPIEEDDLEYPEVIDTSTAEQYRADLEFIDHRITELTSRANGRDLTQHEQGQLANLNRNRKIILDKLDARSQSF